MGTCEYCHKDKEDGLSRFYTNPETHQNIMITLCNECEDVVRNSAWGEGEAGKWIKKQLTF